MHNRSMPKPYANSLNDNLKTKFQEDIKRIQVLSSFFTSNSKELEKYNNNMQKSIISLKDYFSQTKDWTNAVEEFSLNLIEISSTITRYIISSTDTIIQPLESLIITYEKLGKEVITNSDKILDSILQSKKEIEKKKNEYFKYNNDIMNSKEIPESKIKALEEQRNEYKKLIIKFNHKIENYRKNHKKLFEEWEKNEQFKFDFIKCILHTFNNLYHDLTKNIGNFYIPSKKIFDSINYSYKIPLSLPNSKIFYKIIPEFPDFIKDESKKENEFLAKQFPNGITEDDLQFEENKLNNLLDDMEISKLDKEKLMNIVRTKEGMLKLCKDFFNISNKIKLKNKTPFYAISELSRIVLDHLMGKKSIEMGYLSVILELGRLIIYFNKSLNKKTYLREEYIGHPIWKSKFIWLKIIEYRIEQNGRLSASSSSSKSGSETNVKSSNAKSLDENEVKDEDDKSIKRPGLYFSEISTILSEMTFYCIDVNTCRDIILECIKKFNISNDNILQLMSDYESSQQLPRIQKLKIKYAKKITELKRLRYGKLKYIIVLSVSSKLLDNKCLLSLILLSKEWNKTFKERISKLLIRRNPDKYRFPLWMNLIYDKGKAYQYYDAKDKALQSNTKNNMYLNEIIRVDVMRSFHKYPESYQTSIVNILRFYAAHNEKIEYCQGMNCIAGFLFIAFKDEIIAFNMMTILIYKYNLAGLYEKEMPLLHFCFYCLNRLMAIYLPRIHSHFFEERINASYFSPSWFITIFTYVLQYIDEPKIPDLLFTIFDEFVTTGIRALFKFSLFILGHFEKKLITLKYEYLVQYLNEMAKADFFFNPEIEEEYKKKKKLYNITPELLKRLTDEYEEITNISKTHVNEQINADNFLCYVYSESENKYVSVALAK